MNSVAQREVWLVHYNIVMFFPLSFSDPKDAEELFRLAEDVNRDIKLVR